MAESMRARLDEAEDILRHVADYHEWCEHPARSKCCDNRIMGDCLSLNPDDVTVGPYEVFPCEGCLMALRLREWLGTR